MICREDPLFSLLCALVGILLGLAFAAVCLAINALLLVLRILVHG